MGKDNKIRYIDEKAPHCVSEVICIDCCYRWIAVFPEDTPLRLLECGRCHQQGFVIKTGQDLTCQPYVEGGD